MSMGKRKEYEFAELPVDKLILESFADTSSAYHEGAQEPVPAADLTKFRSKLLWHINNSLSRRQREVMLAFLSGRRQRETAVDLGITQQVVNIYKQRAIKRLHRLLVVGGVCQKPN